MNCNYCLCHFVVSYTGVTFIVSGRLPVIMNFSWYSSVSADERPESTSTQDMIASVECFTYSPYTSILALHSSEVHLITSVIN